MMSSFKGRKWFDVNQICQERGDRVSPRVHIVGMDFQGGNEVWY